MVALVPRPGCPDGEVSWPGLKVHADRDKSFHRWISKDRGIPDPVCSLQAYRGRTESHLCVKSKRSVE